MIFLTIYNSKASVIVIYIKFINKLICMTRRLIKKYEDAWRLSTSLKPPCYERLFHNVYVNFLFNHVFKFCVPFVYWLLHDIFCTFNVIQPFTSPP